MNAEGLGKKEPGKGKKETEKEKTGPQAGAKKMEEVEEMEKEMEVVVDKIAESGRIIKNRVIASVGLGLVPVPLVDVLGLTAIQLEMVSKLSRLYEIPFRKDVGKSIIASLVGSVLPVSVTPTVVSLLKAVPIIGLTTSAVTMSVLGGATTYAVGKVFVQHFEAGGTFLDFDPEAVRAYFEEQFEQGKKVASEMKK